MADIFQTIEDTQKTIDNVNKNIDFIDKNKFEILGGIFVAVVLACILANLITK